MATFEITTPEGKVFHVEGDNQEGAVNALHQMLGGAGTAASTAPATGSADPIRIGAPDGSIVHFPAGTSDDTINGAMAKAYPPPGKTTLNIQGRRVSVDDSFLKLSPEEQHSTVDQIANSLGSAPQSTAADVAKSGGIGLVKGGIGLVGMAGDLAEIAKKGADWVGGKLPSVPSPAPDSTLGRLSQFLRDESAKSANLPAAQGSGDLPGSYQPPTGAQIQKSVEGVTGDFYKPKTIAGEYAQTVGEFAPALIGGPESLLAKAATRVALPAAVSETAGQLTKGTAAEPYARVAGALLSPVATAAASRGFAAVQSPIAGMSRDAAGHLIRGVEADGPAAVQARMQELGPDAMLADGGPALLGKAQGASLNSDEGRSVLQTALTRRNEGTNARIQSDVNHAMGRAEDPQTVTDAITAHRSAVDGVNHPAALNNAPPVRIAPIMTDLIDRVNQAPVGSMEHRALTNLQDMLTRTDRRPMVDAQGIRQYDRLGNERWQDVPVSHDDAGILHKVKGELDNVIQYDAPGLGVPAGALTRQQGALKQVRGAINDALEQQVPGYRNANRVSAALAQRGEAVNLGTQYLGSGKTTASPERFAAAFDPLPQGTKIAFAKGSRGEIERNLGTKANDLQALRGQLQGEGGWNGAKIATVHGQPAADELAATVDRNLKFRDTHTKVVEGSQTDLRNAARKEMKPDPSSDTPLFNPNSTLTGMAATVAKKGVQNVVNAMTHSDPTRHYREVARALSEQGPARDARLAAIVDAINSNRVATTATAYPLAGKRALGAAMLAHQGSPEPTRPQISPAVAKVLQGMRP
jgi:hypothetical protein